MKLFAKLKIYFTDKPHIMLRKRKCHGTFRSTTKKARIVVSNRITIDNDNKKFIPRKTLLHELVHFLIWVNGYDANRHTEKHRRIERFLVKEFGKKR